MADKQNRLKMSIAAIYLALKKKETPIWIKIAVVGTVVYILSPIDFFPDISLFGYIDDITLLSIMIAVLNKGIPEDIIKKCKEEIKKRMDKTVDESGKFTEENVIDYDELTKSK